MKMIGAEEKNMVIHARDRETERPRDRETERPRDRENGKCITRHRVLSSVENVNREGGTTLKLLKRPTSVAICMGISSRAYRKEQWYVCRLGSRGHSALVSGIP